MFTFSLRTNLVHKIYSLVCKISKRFIISLRCIEMYFIYQKAFSYKFFFVISHYFLLNPFFGKFYAILVWSINYHYISKNRLLKNVISKKIQAYILSQNSAKSHAFSTMCTNAAKICLATHHNRKNWIFQANIYIPINTLGRKVSNI